MCLFSVIIPVYNTKIEYLEKCIHSVLVQKACAYEIIIVNDGSTNGETLEFLDNLSNEKNASIKILNQENKGVTTARNRGILEAKGKYLMFVDADDFLLDDCFERLEEVVKKRNFEILFFKYKEFDVENKNIKSSEDSYKISDIKEQEELLALIIGARYEKENINHITPWGKIIEREFVIKNKINYEADLSRTEDMVFMFDCCRVANTMGEYNYTGYVYNKNPYSVCAKFDENIFDKLSRACYRLEERIQPDEQELLKYLNIRKTHNYFGTLNFDIFHPDNPKKLVTRIKKARKIYKKEYKELFKENYVCNAMNKKRKIFILLHRYHLKSIVYLIFIVKNKCYGKRIK